ncbi:MAG: DUF3343 domain-containing protein [Eggerthellaceae bacterium]|jgi:hypothetical protein|nr:DUF3343 domain-containing protein [Eggerthellaceae bacterium]
MLVVTFHTTADAFSFEKACKNRGIPGRLTTIPRSISAGCGLSWSAPFEAQEAIEKVIQDVCLQIEDIHVL